MKFIIWFAYYTLIGDCSVHSRTFIRLENDSVTFYVFNLRYVTWKVDSILEYSVSGDEFIQNRYYVSAIISAKFEGIEALIRIKDGEAVIFIDSEELEENIILSRDRPKWAKLCKDTLKL